MDLTLQELARQSQSDVAFVERLIRLGVVTESPDGFVPGDIWKVRTLRAIEAGGGTAEAVAEAVRAGRVNLDFLGSLLPEPGPLSARTFREFIAAQGPRGDLVGPILEMLGLPLPPLDLPMRADDDAMLTRFLDQWAQSPEIALRAARLMGQTTRATTEGWTGLHYELFRGLGGPDRAAWTPEFRAHEEEVARDAIALAAAMPGWLMHHLVERILAADVVENLEMGTDPFAERRQDLPPGARVPAIAFVDVSGFTALTEEAGDRAASDSTTVFEEVVTRAAAAHGGRVVKLLGDGALLHFVDATVAIDAILVVRDALRPRGLQSHAGIDCGPIVERDGDVFGRTVNRAARLAALARPGEIVVSEAVALVSPRARPALEAMGPQELKGIDLPLAAYRLAGDRSPDR